MITKDKKIKQEKFANLTDYSLERPENTKEYFAWVRFEDNSECLLANIFTCDRATANAIVLERFIDCWPYMQGWTVYESEY